MNTNYFYKYYTINQNLLNSIINNELFFSNPRNFNDPFDSFPRFELTDDNWKLRNFYLFIKKYTKRTLTSVASLNNFNTIHNEYKKILNICLNDLNKFDELHYSSIEDTEIRLIEIVTFYNNEDYFDRAISINHIFLQHKLYQDFVFLTIDYYKYGISCGSKRPDCPLMWGHYAQNHAGICIKYNFFDEDSNLVLCLDDNEQIDILDVNYIDKPLKIFDYSCEELENLKFELFINKYYKWEYENEVRLVHKQGLLKIKRTCIEEIIFGCKSSTKDRYSIIKLFASLGYKVNKLSIARVLPDKYELKIENMKLNDIAGSGVLLKELNISDRDKKSLNGLI